MRCLSQFLLGSGALFVCVRRKDCLRQFLVVLYERRELELLVNLTYRDKDIVLEPEVCTASVICCLSVICRAPHTWKIWKRQGILQWLGKIQGK